MVLPDRHGLRIAPSPGPHYQRAMAEPDEAAGVSGLEAVLLANRSALLRFLRARGAGSDAEDILQEVWIKLIGATASGPIAQPLSYLYRMTDNLMHDKHRSSQRRKRREIEWTDAVGSTVAGMSDEPSVERVVIAREGLRQVEQALSRISARGQAIFRRFRFDGVEQRAVAAEQGISLSAVEKHLQRAYLAIMEEQAAGENPANERMSDAD